MEAQQLISVITELTSMIKITLIVLPIFGIVSIYVTYLWLAR